jgi:hypothetical protein
LWEAENTTENYTRSSVSLNGHNSGDIIPYLFGEIYLLFLIIVYGDVNLNLLDEIDHFICFPQ